MLSCYVKSIPIGVHIDVFCSKVLSRLTFSFFYSAIGKEIVLQLSRFSYKRRLWIIDIFSCIFCFVKARFIHAVQLLILYVHYHVSKMHILYAVNPCPAAITPLTLTDNSGNITSPRYPGNYFNWADCNWIITSNHSDWVSKKAPPMKTLVCCMLCANHIRLYSLNFLWRLSYYRKILTSAYWLYLWSFRLNFYCSITLKTSTE